MLPKDVKLALDKAQVAYRRGLVRVRQEHQVAVTKAHDDYHKAIWKVREEYAMACEEARCVSAGQPYVKPRQVDNLGYPIPGTEDKNT